LIDLDSVVFGFSAKNLQKILFEIAVKALWQRVSRLLSSAKFLQRMILQEGVHKMICCLIIFMESSRLTIREAGTAGAARVFFGSSLCFSPGD